MNAREEIAFLLWQVVPSADDAEARATAAQMLDKRDAEVRAATLAEAQDELVAWLVKKASEHGAQGRQYTKQADLICKLADKVDRGAVRIFLEPAAMEARQAIRARALSDFLFLLRYSAGDAAADKLVEENPELAELLTEAGESS